MTKKLVGKMQKIAAKSGTGAAKRMVLEEEEEKNPSLETLKDWADDWWHHEGVPSLEYADATEDDFEDPSNYDAFVKAFIETMQKRLSAK